MTIEPTSAPQGIATRNLEAIDKGPNRMRSVVINQLDRGYYVEVGCQKIAIESVFELISLVTQYIADPNGTEEKYNNGTLFNKQS